MNLLSKTKKIQIIGFCFIVVCVIYLALLFSIFKTTIPKHLITASKQNYGTGLLLNMQMSPEGVREVYSNFSLAVSENLAELSFVCKTTRSYYLGPNGDIIPVTSEMDISRFNKSTYVRIDDIIYTMRVKKVYHGDIKENSLIDIVVQPIGIEIGNCLETDSAIISFQKSNQENLYELQMQYEGIFYIYNDKIYPAMDMTYSEVYGVKHCGNPVENYVGMPVKEFEAELNQLF